MKINVRERTPSIADSSIVRAQGLYILPRPYIPQEQRSRFTAFASYNPSMVSYNGRTYWYQRWSSYTLCGPEKINTTSLPLVCSVPIGASMHFCQPVLPTKELPFIQSNCSRYQGVEDIRLFVHSSGLYGLGFYYKNDRCFTKPVLVKFDGKTHQVTKYIAVQDEHFMDERHEKNWIVVHGSERADGQMAVIKRRDPLSIALIDVKTGRVSGLKDFKRSRVLDLSSFYGEKLALLDLRGSTPYLPFKDSKGREGLLTTLHLSKKTKFNGYLNMFVFTKKTWPYPILSRSKLFYFHSQGLVYAATQNMTLTGWRRPKFKAAAFQFLSGLTYSDRDMKTLLIGYGENDCLSKVMKISTEAVRKMMIISS